MSERRIISSDFLPCGDSFPLIVSIPVKRPSWRATRCSPSRTWRRAVSTVLHSLSAVCISMARRFSVNRSSPPALANTCPLARRMSRLCAFSRKLEFVPSHDTTPEPSSPGRRESCPTNRGGQYVWEESVVSERYHHAGGAATSGLPVRDIRRPLQLGSMFQLGLLTSQCPLALGGPTRAICKRRRKRSLGFFFCPHRSCCIVSVRCHGSLRSQKPAARTMAMDQAPCRLL